VSIARPLGCEFGSQGKENYTCAQPTIIRSALPRVRIRLGSYNYSPRLEQHVKITTWNVNSLTARLQHVLDWTAANPVDVLCMQELKLTDDKFPLDVLRFAGYEHCAVFGQKTYNGVAIMSRHPLRDVAKNMTGFADENSRVIAATVEGPAGELRLVNGYFVNGQAPGTLKFDYKMSWLRGLRDYLREELERHAQLVLLGDFNIAPEDRDSWDPEGLRETIHHTTEERDHFRKLVALGLCDSFRLFEQPEKSFSWWDYRMLGYQKNRGLRIDHILVSEALKPLVKGCAIDRGPRKWKQPSDHAPVTVEI
jgi:exodeoxyribonuclease III